MTENRFTQGCTYVPDCVGQEVMLWCNVHRCGSPLLGRIEDEKDEDGHAEEDSPKVARKLCFPRCDTLWAQGTHGKVPRSGGHTMGPQGVHGAVFPLNTQAGQTHPAEISVQSQERPL